MRVISREQDFFVTQFTKTVLKNLVDSAFDAIEEIEDQDEKVKFIDVNVDWELCHDMLEDEDEQVNVTTNATDTDETDEEEPQD